MFSSDNIRGEFQSQVLWIRDQKLVKILVYCLTFRHKLFVDDSLAIKEANQRAFNLWFVHYWRSFGLWRSWSTLFNTSGLTRLPNSRHQISLSPDTPAKCFFALLNFSHLSHYSHQYVKYGSQKHQTLYTLD